MRKKIDPKQRQQEVAKTGRIPPGTQVHFRRLRNPSLAQLRYQLRKTRAEMAAGSCHPAWGAKQIEGLTRMLEAKLSKAEKKLRI